MEATDSRINIVLKEYDTLRAEVLQRLSARYQLLAVVAALGTLVGTRDVPASVIAVTVAITLVVLAVVWIWFLYDIDRCAEKISEIEDHVNKLAGTRLLSWETTRLQTQGKLERIVVGHLLRRWHAHKESTG